MLKSPSLYRSQHPQPAQSTACARAPSAPRLSLSLKQILPLIVGGVMVLLLAQKLSEFDLVQVRQALAQISPFAWAASLALAAISFRAVAQYDVIAHRILGTGVPRGRALASGASATALAQMLGLGLVTGSLVRWRLLRADPKGAESPARAMSVTGLVAAGFMFGWAITTLIAFATLPTLGGDVAWIGWSVVPVAIALCAASLFAPRFTVFGRRVMLPGLPTLGALVIWAAIDTIAAAGALYVLLPADLGLSFALLVPAFLLALGCGILSGTPGGFGAFELTLLGMTPADAAPAVLAAIVGFRLTYYVLPAMLAAGHVMWPADIALEPLDAAAPTPQTLADGASTPRSAVIRAANDPLSALLFEPGRLVLSSTDHAGHWLVHQGNQALIALGAPFGAGADTMAMTLQAAGHHAGVPIVVYKAPRATAARLRAQGWWHLPLGSEAIISPTSFDITGATHRQLRRKLRHAEKTGVTIEHPAPDAMPHADMAPVARAWADAHGGERGLSMGRYDPALLRQQRVYVARLDGALLAFVSFHVTQDGWMLDLVRHIDAVPDGTMHALIHAAITDAAKARIASLSLDCVPFHLPEATGLGAALLSWAFDKTPSARGLMQFKNSFAPTWQPRALMVQGLSGLLLGGFEIAKALRPQPIAETRASGQNATTSHDNHADYALDA
jgi:phosphatidylglycerol lysyltransferase